MKAGGGGKDCTTAFVREGRIIISSEYYCSSVLLVMMVLLFPVRVAVFDGSFMPMNLCPLPLLQLSSILNYDLTLLMVRGYVRLSFHIPRFSVEFGSWKWMYIQYSYIAVVLELRI